jgi:hypothetical protein
MNHYLVYGEKTDGTIHRYEIYADRKSDAEKKVIGYGYDTAKAFDWEIQFKFWHLAKGRA